MNAQRLMRGTLLAFVVVCVVALAVRQVARVASPPSAHAATSSASASPEHAPHAAAPRYVVTFYHGNTRCSTCHQIEDMAHALVYSAFTQQLEDGQMAWRVINYDDPAHAADRATFELSFQSLIIAEMQGDRVVRWHNLADVWTTVHDSPAVYNAYVQGAIEAFMAESQA